MLVKLVILYGTIALTGAMSELEKREKAVEEAKKAKRPKRQSVHQEFVLCSFAENILFVFR